MVETKSVEETALRLPLLTSASHTIVEPEVGTPASTSPSRRDIVVKKASETLHERTSEEIQEKVPSRVAGEMRSLASKPTQKLAVPLLSEMVPGRPAAHEKQRDTGLPAAHEKHRDTGSLNSTGSQRRPDSTPTQAHRCLDVAPPQSALPKAAPQVIDIAPTVASDTPKSASSRAVSGVVYRMVSALEANKVAPSVAETPNSSSNSDDSPRIVRETEVSVDIAEAS